MDNFKMKSFGVRIGVCTLVWWLTLVTSGLGAPQTADPQVVLQSKNFYLPMVVCKNIPALLGILDTSFSSDGMLVTDLGVFNESLAHAVAVQPDGKIVVAGEVDHLPVLIRYNANGSLDASFGDGGVETNTVIGRGLAVQPDGKILVAGDYAEPSGDFVIVRHNPDGRLDTTFDWDGKVRTDFFGGTDVARDMLLQADGNIIVTGYTSEGEDLVIARYEPDGDLDLNFSSDGKAAINHAGIERGGYVALQPNGKIVVAGYTLASGQAEFMLVRFSSFGDFDTSFGQAGFVVTGFGTSTTGGYVLTDVAVQADGQILAVGDVAVGDSVITIGLAAYTTDGRLDQFFDDDGLVVIGIAGGNHATSLTVQHDGKILLAGSTGYAGAENENFLVLRLDRYGSLDPSFGTGGWLMTDIMGADEIITGLALQADGGLVAAGYASPGFDHFIVLARYR